MKLNNSLDSNLYKELVNDTSVIEFTLILHAS